MNAKDQIDHLPGQILLDLARNESASRDWRKAAVELMLDKGFPQAKHPEVALLVNEIQAERQAKEEVEAVVEAAIEAPVERPSGALSASVTTATLFDQAPDFREEIAKISKQ